jgi:hypothetical protein
MSILTSSAPVADDAFVELVYGDDEWVRAEFAALVATAWASPPVSPPDTRAVAGWPTGHLRAGGTAEQADRPCTPRREEPRLRGRQRSPPVSGRR